MKKNKGFTLIELLATIVILSLILGLAIWASITLIGKSKENTYEVTMNEIKKQVNNYILENDESYRFIPAEGNNEFQCVSIQNLIDAGFFKENITNSNIKIDNNIRNVSKDDNIYIERDTNTKSIIKVEYDNKICNSDRREVYVKIDYFPKEWSKDKTISIYYKILNDNYTTKEGEYSKEYSYSVNGVSTLLENGTDYKKIKVTENGIITGSIVSNGKVIAKSEYNITTIDNEPPVVDLYNMEKIYSVAFDLYEGVNISDNSGIIKSKQVFIGDKEIKSYKDLSIGNNVLTYVVKDGLDNITKKNRNINIIVPDKEFNFEEREVVYDVLANGTYIIEAYGARGSNNGGLGGYVKGEVYLPAGSKLYINVGGTNGYNGGGGYRNGSIHAGGGASTIKYNNQLIIIAAGGGAKGTTGTGGAGGNGNSAGGANAGAGAGINGYNGGGGSSSADHSYRCCESCERCAFNPDPGGTEWGWYSDCVYYDCNCRTCSKSGASGNGGSNRVAGGVSLITNSIGVRNGNGYISIKYKR